MTKREIEKLLKKAGFIKKSGGRHDIWIKPDFPPIPIHRHKKDIPTGTLNNILKHAGLKEEK
jgi:predicted RNA binding protein YcfA (HicA-like mRNA interferase family)